MIALWLLTGVLANPPTIPPEPTAEDFEGYAIWKRRRLKQNQVAVEAPKTILPETVIDDDDAITIVLEKFMGELQ